MHADYDGSYLCTCVQRLHVWKIMMQHGAPCCPEIKQYVPTRKSASLIDGLSVEPQLCHRAPEQIWPMVAVADLLVSARYFIHAVRRRWSGYLRVAKTRPCLVPLIADQGEYPAGRSVGLRCTRSGFVWMQHIKPTATIGRRPPLECCQPGTPAISARSRAAACRAWRNIIPIACLYVRACPSA